MAWTFQSLIDDRMTVTAYCHNPAPCRLDAVKAFVPILF